MVLSWIPDPPGFYPLCIVVPSGGCRVGFSPELVAWWARAPCVQIGPSRATFRPMGAAYGVPGDSYVGRLKKTFPPPPPPSPHCSVKK
ncbi:hypothetical protein Hanom_Chr11g01021261 [Helianthus anomalus]